jgi:hypothetical protein
MLRRCAKDQAYIANLNLSHTLDSITGAKDHRMVNEVPSDAILACK